MPEPSALRADGRRRSSESQLGPLRRRAGPPKSAVTWVASGSRGRRPKRQINALADQLVAPHNRKSATADLPTVVSGHECPRRPDRGLRTGFGRQGRLSLTAGHTPSSRNKALSLISTPMPNREAGISDPAGLHLYRTRPGNSWLRLAGCHALKVDADNRECLPPVSSRPDLS